MIKVVQCKMQSQIFLKVKIIYLLTTYIHFFSPLQRVLCKLLSPIIASSIFFVPISHATNIPKLTMMTEYLEPYNFEKNGVVKGISVDILVLMLDKVGSTQNRDDIKIYPWMRAYTMVKEKNNTVLFSTVRTKQREKMFKWVGPIFNVKYNIYALKNKKIKISKFEDLKNYKIGTLRGDITEDLLVKYAGLQLSDLDRISSYLGNMKKLSAERISLIAASKNTVMSMHNKAGLNYEDLEPVFILGNASTYYAFNKNTPDDLINLFQKAFDKLKDEGKIAEIFKQYGKKL